MSDIADMDTALMRVHSVEMTADMDDDTDAVNACQIVLDRLLDARLHLPRQRTP